VVCEVSSCAAVLGVRRVMVSDGAVFPFIVCQCLNAYGKVKNLKPTEAFGTIRQIVWFLGDERILPVPYLRGESIT